jgi:DNA-binding CsgD family transcriptional regulator
MDNKKVILFNRFVNEAYDCHSFIDFLKLAIMKLHELVIYDSGMFFCAISKDCSFFKPYIGGDIDLYYKKRSFEERDSYRNSVDSDSLSREAYVYKAADYAHGLIKIDNEPRYSFLADQTGFHIVCIRIIYKNEFLGEIYLHRSKEKPDFDDEDLFALRLLQPHVSTVFSIIHTITAVKYMETSDQTSSQKGMCMFDKELSLISGSVSGIEILKMATDLGSSVLYHVKEQCADIIDENPYGVNEKGLMRSIVLKIHNNDLAIDIYAKKTNSFNNNDRFVVTMEFMNEAQALADYKFKFSKREAEVIDGLIQGKNNSRLAELLNLSENTIKTHIKNIYRKTGTNNRTELAYVLMLNK